MNEWMNERINKPLLRLSSELSEAFMDTHCSELLVPVDSHEGHTSLLLSVLLSKGGSPGRDVVG